MLRLILLPIAFGLSPLTAHAQTCPRGLPAVGDIGIEVFHCVAGRCGIADIPGERWYSFSVEPLLWGVRADGPAAGKLQDRDVLLEVDGLAITTEEGGRHLANLAPNTDVATLIRRGNQRLRRTLKSDAACSIPMLIWSETDTGQRPQLGGSRATQTRPTPASLRPAASLELSVECDDCGWRLDANRRIVWHSSAPPLVRAVDPGGVADRAGIRAGDALLLIDGQPIDRASGGQRMGALRPGETVRFTIRRDGQERVVTLQAAAPARPQKRL